MSEQILFFNSSNASSVTPKILKEEKVKETSKETKKERNIRPNVEKMLEFIKNNKDVPITDPPLRQIKSLQFGPIGAEEIKDISVCKITKSNITNPFFETVYDERMGPSDIKGICSTCLEKIRICPGHFGYMELAVPVINPQFTKTVVDILNCICLTCSKLRMSKEELELELETVQPEQNPPTTHFKKVLSILSNVSFCQSCQELVPEITLSDEKIYKVFSDTSSKKLKTKSILSVEEIQSILKQVSNDSLILLGFNLKFRKTKKHNIIEENLPSFRPEHLIITVLPVLPIVSRPPNFEGGMKNNDDLTSSYVEICKNNQKILEGNLKEKEKEDKIAILESHIKSFIDNTDESTKHTSGKPIKSIKERLSNKTGLIRGKMMGKRVDVSARTVITADTTLYLDEVGVPQQIAEDLTFPEYVCQKNIKHLNTLLQKNKVNMVERDIDEKGIMKKKKFMIMDYKPTNFINELKIGDIAYRHLQDGDVVVFNRQPTLHRGGMMGHTVKVLPFKTFRLNLSVTNAYNADFDGDEMQLHVPQDYTTAIEVKEIMGVNNHIISSQSNKPIMAIFQDCLIGSQIMTKKENIPKNQFMDCVFSAGKQYVKVYLDMKKKIPKERWYSGKTLFSVLLPRDFNYVNKERDVVIEKGIMISGYIDSKSIGKGYYSIHHRLYKEYSKEVASEFLSAIQFMINRFLIFHGFSTGISDFIVTKEEVEKVKESINKAYIEVQGIVENHEGSDDKIVEFKINSVLNAATQSINLLTNPNNRLEIMINSGSKGNKMNITQIKGCLGQNNVEGKRIVPELDDRSRTLPCFERGDNSPPTRGHIRRSLMQGLTPSENWYHIKAGREGVINTAVKTQESGYTHRKLVKRMEDLVVENDYSVRNSVGNIVKFVYGSDNMDSTWYLNCKTKFIDIDSLVSRLNCQE